jgi:hypothetical protein
MSTVRRDLYLHPTYLPTGLYEPHRHTTYPNLSRQDALVVPCPRKREAPARMSSIVARCPRRREPHRHRNLMTFRK